MSTKKKKKMWSMVLSAALMFSLLVPMTACGGRTSNDGNTLKVAVVADDTWAEALQEQFPEIEFEIEYYGGANPSGYLKEHLIHEDSVPDVFISSFMPEEKLQKEGLMDLSVYDYADRYRSNFIHDCSVDGSIHLLPGAFQINCYAYNKTLFKEHGWKKPENNRELLRLVKQIRREAPELVPISVPGKLAGYGIQYMNFFAQCGFLSTHEGMAWQEKFIRGEAKAEAGFGQAAEEMQKLINAGAFGQNLDKKGVLECAEELAERKAAIAYHQGGFSNLNQSESEDEYGAFPFYGAKKDEYGVAINVARFVGLGKHLEKGDNKEKLENALKVMDWLTTAEGLPVLTSAFADTVLPLKESPAKEMPQMYQDVFNYIEDGYVLQSMSVYSNYADVVVQTGWAVLDAMMGNSKMTDALAVMNRTKADSAAVGGKTDLGEVKERMNNAEAAQFTANLYLDTGLGQIALVHGAPSKYTGNFNGRGGVNGTMYEGVLTEDNCTINVPFNKFFVTLKLTGSQIQSLLEEGAVYTAADGSKVVCPYYFAGMEAVIDKGKVKSMKFNGKEMDNEAVYTVVMNQDGYTRDNLGDAKVHEDFPATTAFFKEWLAKDGHHVIEKPEVLR